MDFFFTLANKIGFAVCHQIPSRTIVIGGIYLPLAGRTSGIYIGFLISAIVLFILYRKKENEWPPRYILITFFISIVSTGADWVLSHMGVYESSNSIRFITGFLAGSSMMAFIFPVFINQYYKKSKDLKIFKSLRKTLLYFLILAAFIIITLFRFSFLSYFYYYLSALSVIFTFYFINFLMVILIPVFANKAHRTMSRFLILPSIISLILITLELFVSYKLHQFFLNFSL